MALSKEDAAEIVARLDDISQRMQHTAVSDDCAWIRAKVVTLAGADSSIDVAAAAKLLKRHKRRGQVKCAMCKCAGHVEGKPCSECQD